MKINDMSHIATSGVRRKTNEISRIATLDVRQKQMKRVIKPLRASDENKRRKAL